MRHRQQYSSAATAAGLLALTVVLGIIGAVLLAAFRGLQWLIGLIA